MDIFESRLISDFQKNKWWNSKFDIFKQKVIRTTKKINKKAKNLKDPYKDLPRYYYIPCEYNQLFPPVGIRMSRLRILQQVVILDTFNGAKNVKKNIYEICNPITGEWLGCVTYESLIPIKVKKEQVYGIIARIRELGYSEVAKKLEEDCKE
jgi:hypothetical protein